VSPLYLVPMPMLHSRDRSCASWKRLLCFHLPPMTAAISVHFYAHPFVPRCARIMFCLSSCTNTLGTFATQLGIECGISAWWVDRLYVARTASFASSLVVMLEYVKAGFKALHKLYCCIIHAARDDRFS
jgi:hypothetical protein